MGCCFTDNKTEKFDWNNPFSPEHLEKSSNKPLERTIKRSKWTPEFFRCLQPLILADLSKTVYSLPLLSGMLSEVPHSTNGDELVDLRSFKRWANEQLNDDQALDQEDFNIFFETIVDLFSEVRSPEEMKVKYIDDVSSDANQTI